MTNEQVTKIQAKIAILEGQFKTTQNRLKQDMTRLIKMVEHKRN